MKQKIVFLLISFFLLVTNQSFAQQKGPSKWSQVWDSIKGRVSVSFPELKKRGGPGVIIDARGIQVYRNKVVLTNATQHPIGILSMDQTMDVVQPGESRKTSIIFENLQYYDVALTGLVFNSIPIKKEKNWEIDGRNCLGIASAKFTISSERTDLYNWIIYDNNLKISGKMPDDFPVIEIPKFSVRDGKFSVPGFRQNSLTQLWIFNNSWQELEMQMETTTGSEIQTISPHGLVLRGRSGLERGIIIFKFWAKFEVLVMPADPKDQATKEIQRKLVRVYSYYIDQNQNFHRAIILIADPEGLITQ